VFGSEAGTTKFYQLTQKTTPLGVVEWVKRSLCWSSTTGLPVGIYFVIPEIASAIIRDPEANPNLFYSWVPDTTRYARSSGTTGQEEGVFGSEAGTTMFYFVILKLQPFLVCHSYFLFCHPGNCVSNYPGSRSQSQSFLLLGPGYHSLRSQFRDDKVMNLRLNISSSRHPSNPFRFKQKMTSM